MISLFINGALGLVSVRAECWGGFIFLNFDSQAPSVMVKLGEVAERFKNHKLEDMRVTKQWPARLQCNWKTWLENSREGYHVNMVHRRTIQKFYQGDRGDLNRRVVKKPGLYEMTSLSNEGGMYVPKNPPFPMVDGLSAEDQESTHYVMVPPMFIFQLMPSHLVFHQLLPEGPETTTVVTWMCFPKSTVERPDFDDKVKLYYEIPETFIPEDREICEQNQRGVRARLARLSRFALRESACHSFANYLLDGVVGRPTT